MSKHTCSVAECDRTAKSRGWCQTHYMFWYKNRIEPTGPIRKWGQRNTLSCSVDGCDAPYASVGYCAPHYKRYAKHGNPGEAKIAPRSVGDDAGYALAHLRLRKQRGSAVNHSCIKCDGRAQQWAYDHLDQHEKVDERGYAYSVNLSHYKPMCTSCHKRFDLAHINAAQLQCARGCEN